MEAATLFRDVRAVIFDLDGALIRTDRLQYESYRRALRRWDADLDSAFFRGLAGKARRETCRRILRHCGVDRPWAQLAEAFERELQRVTAETPIPVIPEAEQFLRAVPGRKFQRVLTSTSPMDWIERLLERTELGRHFDLVVAGDELPNKPEPDLYLCAFDAASVRPWYAVVIEDSEPGVIAAVRSGARVVAVPTETTRHQDFSRAHVRVDSLAQLLPFLKAAAGAENDGRRSPAPRQARGRRKP